MDLSNKLSDKIDRIKLKDEEFDLLLKKNFDLTNKNQTIERECSYLNNIIEDLKERNSYLMKELAIIAEQDEQLHYHISARGVKMNKLINSPSSSMNISKDETAINTRRERMGDSYY